MNQKITTLASFIIATSAICANAANQCPTAQNHDNYSSSSVCNDKLSCPSEDKGGDCNGAMQTSTNCFVASNPSYYDQKVYRKAGSDCSSGCVFDHTNYNTSYYPTIDGGTCTAN